MNERSLDTSCEACCKSLILLNTALCVLSSRQTVRGYREPLINNKVGGVCSHPYIYIYIGRRFLRANLLVYIFDSRRFDRFNIDHSATGRGRCRPVRGREEGGNTGRLQRLICFDTVALQQPDTIQYPGGISGA
jgi:hypothetical protein